MKNFYLLFTGFQLYSLYFSCSLGEEITTIATDTVNSTVADNSTTIDNSTIAATDNSTIAATDNSTIAMPDNSTLTNATETAISLSANETVTVMDMSSNITDISGNLTESSDGHKTDLCVHEGHDASIDPQTADPGIFMSIEVLDENKSILHIHAKEKFKGIMISTTTEGNFSIPDKMPLKLMNITGCTGVTNSDETEKDHVMVNFEKTDDSSDDAVFNIVLVRAQDKYWTGIQFPEMDEDKKIMGSCVHPGHNHDIPSQANAESGIIITSETQENSTITLHIHADDNPFTGIMISTEAKGNFSIPEGNTIKLMDGDCTGVTNTDDIPKDHVMVNFQKADPTSTKKVDFNLLVVRDNETYWDNIKYQA